MQEQAFKWIRITDGSFRDDPEIVLMSKRVSEPIRALIKFRSELKHRWWVSDFDIEEHNQNVMTSFEVEALVPTIQYLVEDVDRIFSEMGSEWYRPIYDFESEKFCCLVSAFGGREHLRSFSEDPEKEETIYLPEFEFSCKSTFVAVYALMKLDLYADHLENNDFDSAMLELGHFFYAHNKFTFFRLDEKSRRRFWEEHKLRKSGRLYDDPDQSGRNRKLDQIKNGSSNQKKFEYLKDCCLEWYSEGDWLSDHDASQKLAEGKAKDLAVEIQLQHEPSNLSQVIYRAIRATKRTRHR